MGLGFMAEGCNFVRVAAGFLICAASPAGGDYFSLTTPSGNCAVINNGTCITDGVNATYDNDQHWCVTFATFFVIFFDCECWRGCC